MKKLTITFFTMLFVLNVHAAGQSNPQPSDAEIAQNRACFHDLEVQGCRSQEEDPEQFKSCLANAHDSLDEYCKKMMLELYGE